MEDKAGFEKMEMSRTTTTTTVVEVNGDVPGDESAAASAARKAGGRRDCLARLRASWRWLVTTLLLVVVLALLCHQAFKKSDELTSLEQLQESVNRLQRELVAGQEEVGRRLRGSQNTMDSLGRELQNVNETLWAGVARLGSDVSKGQDELHKGLSGAAQVIETLHERVQELHEHHNGTLDAMDELQENVEGVNWTLNAMQKEVKEQPTNLELRDLIEEIERKKMVAARVAELEALAAKQTESAGSGAEANSMALKSLAGQNAAVWMGVLALFWWMSVAVNLRK